MLTTTVDVRAWLRDNAIAIDSTDPDFLGPDLDALIARLGAATVVGLGESTRFSRQTFGVRERIFRALVERYGFRALAIQDSARSGERWDRFVTAGDGDPETVLAGAWRPWRTEESVATLRWIRAYNLAHPDDPVRIFGVEPPHAEPSDYDAVLAYVRDTAPDRSAAIEAHLAPIRTAHQIDEHVQRHQGIHPGRPFAEHAEDAVALLETLPDTPERVTALAHARLILDFHRQSVASQGFARDERPSAETVLNRQRTTGAKIVYWDGLAHTTNLPISFGPAEFRGTGSHLHDHFGDAYVSVGIGFHHGDLGVAVAPDPLPDLVDAALGAVELPVYYLDLHTDAPESVRAWLAGPAKVRTISGVYDPAADAEANIRLASLAAAFDVLIHVRETAPVHWL
ncbi:erythromycin esterase family protein [Nocardia sp. NBC_00508]|uniref:erythromycin esterase family protein n=1 Tax=Nocardia sp. NBC_00508 TaxID=2975992 RepID=UPI002E80F774|nr:erythromycin esterase family protein [Nocardia sp. NBC_00508]WUD69210.1 erythromycin esterase family protein [Nocardia sp. NBC_00508]